MKKVDMYEEHGEVVATWRSLGYRDQHIVCFDRHLDLKPMRPLSSDQVETILDDPARLNRNLPMREAPGAFGLDDFWAVGPIGGRISRLTWVLPETQSRTRDRRSVLGSVAFIKADPDVIHHTRFEGDRLITSLCGLELEVRTFEDLLQRPPADDFRIDIDLDWFADAGAPLDINPDAFAGALIPLGGPDRLDSATYSITSGFLSESQRFIGHDVLEAMGAQGEASRRDRSPTPDGALAALRSATELTGASLGVLWDTELAAHGALGRALLGLLRLRTGGSTPSSAALELAEEDWLRAADGGLSSSWLAYELGIHRFRQQKFLDAALWLDRAVEDFDDPLEGHAALLATLSVVRLGRFEEAALRARTLVDRFPLSMRALELLLLIEGQLGDHSDGALVERSHFLNRLVTP